MLKPAVLLHMEGWLSLQLQPKAIKSTWTSNQAAEGSLIVTRRDILVCSPDPPWHSLITFIGREFSFA